MSRDFGRCSCGVVFMVYGSQSCTCHRTTFFGNGSPNNCCGTCRCKALTAKREARKPVPVVEHVHPRESEEQAALRAEFHSQGRK